jgi:hypothetical protein
MMTKVPDRFVGISNEVGRCKSYFSWVLASSGHTHPLARKSLDRCARVFTLDARICVASSLRCCPPTISSVIADHDDLCELPSCEGRRVA